MSNQDDNAFDDKLTTMAGAMSTEVAPERDLWAGIERSIAAPARPSRNAWNTVWAQAAAVLLLVGGSSFVTYYATTSAQSGGRVTIVNPNNLFETVSGEFGATYTLGNEYLDARSQLETDLESKLDTLTPEARLEVVDNINSIRRAINEINKALAIEPDNALLHDLLLSTYHDEMDLMIKVDGIANAAMRRDDI